MNKILREEMEYLITCNDKAITPDVRDDVEMTLKYIDELEEKIHKANIRISLIQMEDSTNKETRKVLNDLVDILGSENNE